MCSYLETYVPLGHGIYACLSAYSFYRVDNADEHYQPNPVQQLKLELSHKRMIFSKNCIKLSRVVGQGMYVVFSQRRLCMVYNYLDDLVTLDMSIKSYDIEG